MNKFKVISSLAVLLSISLLGFFILNMPALPTKNVDSVKELDLSAFKEDISKLDLPKEIYVSSVKKYEGKYYISDALAKKVYCIDENSKILWESKGESGFILPNLNFPLDISEDGNLWVSNTGKLHLEQLNLETGAFIAIWQPRDRFKGCCNPIEILALSAGRFLTMEKGTNLLKLYQPDGSGKVLDKLDGNWQNYMLKKSQGKVEYCNGVAIKTIDILE